MSTIGRYPDAEPGLRILADMVREAAAARRNRLPFVAGEAVVTRHDWLHGLLPCPACGLPLDAARDLDHELFAMDAGTAPIGAWVIHRRCGATFRIVFER